MRTASGRASAARRGLASIAVASCLAGAAPHAASSPDRLPPPSTYDKAHMPRADDQLHWTEDEKLVGHRNMHLLFPSGIVEAGDAVHALPRGAPLTLRYRYDGRALGLDDYFRRTATVALLVVKDGRIVLERYGRGDTRDTVSASRSMAKSVTSTLIGAAIADGSIHGLDDTVARYVPELADTRYGPVRIRDLLQMSSGVDYYENPADPSSDLVPLQGCVAHGHRGCLLAFLRMIGTRPQKIAVEPGSRFAYATADAVLEALIVERATGRSMPDYLSRRIWRPYGMEHAAYWNKESPDGVTFGGSGFGATLRDYGRLGLFLLDDGRLPGRGRALPADWMAMALAPSAASVRAGRPYGFNWWLPPSDAAQAPPMAGGESTFYGRGSSGQVLMVDRAERVVVVKWATWGDGSSAARQKEDAVVFAAIANALHR